MNVFENLGERKAKEMVDELIAKGYSEDDAFTEVYSIECSMDNEENLVPRGTKVVYRDVWTDRERIGIIDGNDLETTEEDEEVNYYIIPLEYIDEEEPSTYYEMLLREDFEIIGEEM